MFYTAILTISMVDNWFEYPVFHGFCYSCNVSLVLQIK